MWARVVEIILGCWLILSPFIFGHSGDQKALWLNDILSGLTVVAMAAASFSRTLRHTHLAICGIALWLMGFGYLASGYPAPPALQNDLLVGLLLLMFAIIPNEAFLPPRPWQNLFSKDAPAKAEAQQERAKLREI